jgi:hypothetical protein
MTDISKRREFLKLGIGGAVLAGAAGMGALSAQKAAAQSAPGSLLRTVIDRGHLIVGTGSTNALALRGRGRKARRHGHHHGADPGQGPLR